MIDCSAAPVAVFLAVLILQLAMQFLHQASKSSQQEARVVSEIRSLLREANALAGPSTFAQSAKLRRAANAKEKELSQIRIEAKGKNASTKLVLFVVKACFYCAFVWWFWQTPVASVPAHLVQPFGKVLSFPSKVSEAQSLVQIGILPWLVLSTRVSLSIANAVLK
ncbi:tail-anchored protein insertion receptor WRB-like [Selaginella moellendorffii]|uniref:tail-anchored protein insertion receptor WRB-like n=1 Tax=Selaginella moellendorffii TaxID=88036 RepID=UPI000D1CA5BD|nr:tail-anchored protein insertion receptor WRB-like [Selaginella moellendorffii]|eukprot:XP_024534619.1 tail-anchored protein insertion receptor WRB-like [Selaginella moellendorffii]